MRLALTVNGSPVAAEVEPRTSLADFLRHFVQGRATLCIQIDVVADGRKAARAEKSDGHHGAEHEAAEAAGNHHFDQTHALATGFICITRCNHADHILKPVLRPRVFAGPSPRSR